MNLAESDRQALALMRAKCGIVPGDRVRHIYTGSEGVVELVDPNIHAVKYIDDQGQAHWTDNQYLEFVT